jgi:hypothetical protein
MGGEFFDAVEPSEDQQAVAPLQFGVDLGRQALAVPAADAQDVQPERATDAAFAEVFPASGLSAWQDEVGEAFLQPVQDLMSTLR